METEGVTLEVTDDAIAEIASVARSRSIPPSRTSARGVSDGDGADPRRDLLTAPDRSGETIVIDAKHVRDETSAKNSRTPISSRFILCERPRWSDRGARREPSAPPVSRRRAAPPSGNRMPQRAGEPTHACIPSRPGSGRSKSVEEAGRRRRASNTWSDQRAPRRHDRQRQLLHHRGEGGGAAHLLAVMMSE